jgi:membrane protein CcdC involved in cytochrome C biogenesis
MLTRNASTIWYLTFVLPYDSIGARKENNMNDVLIVIGYFLIGLVLGIIVSRKIPAGSLAAMLIFIGWPIVLPVLALFGFFMWVEFHD